MSIFGDWNKLDHNLHIDSKINYKEKYSAKYEAYFSNKLNYDRQVMETNKSDLKVTNFDIDVKNFKNNLLNELFTDKKIFPWVDKLKRYMKRLWFELFISSCCLAVFVSLNSKMLFDWWNFVFLLPFVVTLVFLFIYMKRWKLPADNTKDEIMEFCRVLKEKRYFNKDFLIYFVGALESDEESDNRLKIVFESVLYSVVIAIGSGIIGNWCSSLFSENDASSTSHFFSIVLVLFFVGFFIKLFHYFFYDKNKFMSLHAIRIINYILLLDLINDN